MVRLSVVIPTYNRKQSLLTTLDGLGRQTYSREAFEVLVVCDGCSDGTESLLAGYEATAGLTLRVLSQQNSGPARARNHGIEAATGDVIVFLDDDVEPVEGFLAAHAAHHASDTRVAVIGPMVPDPKRQGEEPHWIAWEHAMLERQYANWRNGVWDNVGPHNFYSGNASVRREHLLAVGGFDEEFKRQEDVEVATRMGRECGLHFVFDAEATGVHRPVRSLESWLNIPFSYGRLDVVRARRGDASWGVVRWGYHARKPVTQRLADLTLSVPWTTGPICGALLAASGIGHRLGLPGLARAGMTVLYNLRYLHGAGSELGRGELRELLKPQPQPSAPTAANSS